jgi:hypothetical protein
MIKKLSIILTTIILLFTFTKETLAQQLQFQIYPAIIEIESKPGETITQKITIKGSGGQTYQLKTYALEVTSNYGHFTSSTKQVEGLDWVSFNPQEFTFTGYEEKKVSLTVDIPQNAKLADYYLTISLEKIAEDQEEMTFGGSLEIPLLITVTNNGEPKTQGEIKKFTAPYVDFYNPIRFDLEVENSGQRKIKSFGKIEITNKITGETYSKELLPQNILSNSSRVVIDENSFVKGNEYIGWNSPHIAGIYSARVDIFDKYSEKTDAQIITSSKEKIFVYFNIYLLLTVVLITLSIFFFLIQSKRRKHRERDI